jgi:hypothetical protein
MLLGVQGSFEDDGKYYTDVKGKAQAAVQHLWNEAAVEAGLPSLASAIPECTPGGDIEVRQLLAFAKEPCIDVIPFTLSWQGSQARLEGSGSTECTHVEENLGGSPIAIHQISQLDLVFDGTATSGSPGTLEVTMTVSGEIIEFYSNIPPESPQVFTEENPFQVPADGSFPLKFEFRQGATVEILNKEGQAAFTFILHLDDR